MGSTTSAFAKVAYMQGAEDFDLNEQLISIAQQLMWKHHSRGGTGCMGPLPPPRTHASLHMEGEQSSL